MISCTQESRTDRPSTTTGSRPVTTGGGGSAGSGGPGKPWGDGCVRYLERGNGVADVYTYLYALNVCDYLWVRCMSVKMKKPKARRRNVWVSGGRGRGCAGSPQPWSSIPADGSRVSGHGIARAS